MFLIDGCGVIMFSADMSNPCNTKNAIDCAEWKKNFPKEYNSYEKRMQKYEQSGKLKKYQEKHKN